MIPFPHRYSASLSRTYARIEAPLLPELHGGPSPEPGGGVHPESPEHMLLSSLGLCMLTTFEAFAARDGIDVLAWGAKVGGTVENTPEGLMFTSIVLELDMTLAGNVDRAEATLEDAKQECLVLNSLRIPVVIETQLRTANDVAIEAGNEARIDLQRQLLGERSPDGPGYGQDPARLRQDAADRPARSASRLLSPVA
jgi:organic hydroperoxide reductase OsmC/OhrA